MVYKLGDGIIEKCGNKAMFLSLLKAKGYNVPLGIVIDFEEFKLMLKEQNLDFEIIDKLQIPDKLIEQIFSIIPNNRRLAIRSSANVDDRLEFSLAGKYNTYLNVAYDKECVKDKIKSCFLSLYSKDSLKFYDLNNIDINKVEMNVIVQEMIESNVSGILFTVNPTSGKDTEIIIEFSRGAGDVVTGKTNPERLVYDWKNQKYVEDPKINLLGESSVRKIINISLTLQQELGFPINVEFGVYDSKLYIFQIRPITKIDYNDIYNRFCNLNQNPMKILSPFLTSIEKEVYTDVEIEFAKKVKDITENDILKPIVFSRFSRLYWNLDFLKLIYENIPGYIERNFDEYLNIRTDYLGEGVKNISEKENVITSILNNNVLGQLKKCMVDTDAFRTEAFEQKEKALKIEDRYERVERFINLYRDIQKRYLMQRMICIAYMVNLNQKFNKILSKSEVQNLLIAIDNKYENAPFLYMWDSTRKVRADKEKMKFFEENLDAEIYYFYRKDRDNELVKEFLTDFIDTYGYHSFDESDILSNTYNNEVLRVIKMYRDVLDLDDSYNPLQVLKDENARYEKVLQKLKEETKPAQYKASMKHIEYVRSLKKKEYALKDLTLIFKAQLREELINIGKAYKEKYALDSEEDIFYLDYNDVINDRDLDSVRAKVNLNKIYYNSFRNYTSQSDIFPCVKQQIQLDYRKKFNGIGVSFGKIAGRACVVTSKEDLKNLKRADIIVTNYIDNEIFEKVNMAHISGIVTESGGMLCNVAIRSRENRIPCVVGIENITESIRTGENIIINGNTGEVIV